MIHPSLLFVRCEFAVIALGSCFDEFAIIASGNDALSIGGAGENGAGMNDDTFLAALTCE
jgi:hypothetical protein